MTVTALRGRERPPAAPRTRSAADRRRRVGTEAPGALTVSFEVTLDGETRYAEALRILDTLRQATAHLGTANLELVPGPGRGGIESRPSPAVVTVGDDIEIRLDSRTVTRAGREVPFTRMEFDLLAFLADHPGQVFGRSQLLVGVWGHEHAGHRTVDVHIRRLRAKLGDRLVTTVRGVGYRLGNKLDVRILPPLGRV